jgi:hypothetical protein
MVGREMKNQARRRAIAACDTPGQRRRRDGRWQPSRLVRRLGPLAGELETLISRDRPQITQKKGEEGENRPATETSEPALKGRPTNSTSATPRPR